MPLERALNGTPGMMQLRSESLFGLSLVTLTFDDDADPFISRMQVAQRIAAQADLPDGVTPKLAPEATPLGEVYQFRVASDRHDLYQTARASCEWTVTRVLKQVPGVADVVTFGGYLKEVHVRAYPDRLRAHGLTLTEVGDALAKSNLNVGGGFLRHGDQELTVRGIGYIALGRGHPPHGARRARDGTPVTVGDVAEIVQSNTPRRGAVGCNEQKEAVEGFVLHAPRREPVARARRRAREGRRAERQDPAARACRSSRSTTARSSSATRCDTVNNNLLHGFLLVVGRGVAVPAQPHRLADRRGGDPARAARRVHRPVRRSAAGQPDLDGRDRLRHPGRRRGGAGRERDARHAARAAADAARACCASSSARPRQVARPTLYAMLIIIAALMPVFTLQQVEGRIFRPLALTYSFALVGALVLALTLVPALCAVGFGRGTRSAREPRWIERRAVRYRALARRGCSARAAPMLGVAAAFLVATRRLWAARLGTEFLPELDEGDIVMFVEMPPSIALESGADHAGRGAQAHPRLPRGRAGAVASTAAPRTAPTTRTRT